MGPSPPSEILICPLPGQPLPSRISIRPHGGQPLPSRILICPPGGQPPPSRILIRPLGGQPLPSKISIGSLGGQSPPSRISTRPFGGQPPPPETGSHRSGGLAHRGGGETRAKGGLNLSLAALLSACSVIVRAGEIEPAPRLRAEELALALFETPAAVGAGPHHLVRRGTVKRGLPARETGKRFHAASVGPPAGAVKGRGSVRPSSFPDQGQSSIEDFGRKVHSRREELLDDGPSGGKMAFPFCLENKSKGTDEGNAQGLCATSSGEVVHDGCRSGVGQAPGQHGRLARAEPPSQYLGSGRYRFHFSQPRRMAQNLNGGIARTAMTYLLRYRARNADSRSFGLEQVDQTGMREIDEG